MSRRQCLAFGLGCAGWEAATGLAAVAAATQKDRELWALLADPHLAEDSALESRGACMRANLDRVVQQVLSAGSKPYGVLINGDCAFKDGQVGDYVQMVKALGPLKEQRVQVHCTLGNHDDRAAFLSALAEPGAEPLMAEKHVSVLRSARVNWVLLDSLDEVDRTPGRLGVEQLHWLRRRLRDLPDKPTLVMVHHNPPTAAVDGKTFSGLMDGAELMEELAKWPKVKAVFYGHTHRWEVVPPEGAGPWRVNLPPTSYVFDDTRPNGWVAARVTDDGMELELRALNVNHPQHGERVMLPL